MNKIGTHKFDILSIFFFFLFQVLGDQIAFRYRVIGEYLGDSINLGIILTVAIFWSLLITYYKSRIIKFQDVLYSLIGIFLGKLISYLYWLFFKVHPTAFDTEWLIGLVVSGFHLIILIIVAFTGFLIGFLFNKYKLRS